MNILIVEDEVVLGEILSEFLQDEGHTVRNVGNGEDALHILSGSEGLPQVVLADIKMPRMDGRELLRRMKASAIHIPIIFLSGQINVTDQDAITAGAAGIIHKPFDFDQVVEKLNQIQLPV